MSSSRPQGWLPPAGTTLCAVASLSVVCFLFFRMSLQISHPMGACHLPVSWPVPHRPRAAGPAGLCPPRRFCSSCLSRGSGFASKCWQTAITCRDVGSAQRKSGLSWTALGGAGCPQGTQASDPFRGYFLRHMSAGSGWRGTSRYAAGATSSLSRPSAFIQSRKISGKPRWGESSL